MIKRNPSIMIVGAGMTGILMAIKLREAGFTDFHILEKSDRLGGTWRDNTYPGVACDIAAHQYTYSFAPNPEWSNQFPQGAEIQQYFENVSDKFGVTEQIQFNESVTSAIYDRGRWTVTTSQDKTYVVDFVINCTGILHHPVKPDIAGIDKFQGDMFHTAQWDHSVDLKGKKVGIIGTGSTAAQIVPAIADTVDTLTVFQRTPHWVMPIGDKQFSEKDKQRFRNDPKAIKRRRWRHEWFTQNFVTRAVTGEKIPGFIFSSLCKLYLRFAIKDPVLRKKMTPDYKVGCKRIVISKTFYPAMQKPNVLLEDNGIDCITENGIRCKGGRELHFDVLVLATGFNPTAYMRPIEMRGKNGLHINEAWSKKIRNYRSIIMPNFPNNFLMLGPNTPIGNYSVIAMSEVQCGYILKLLKLWQQGKYDELNPTEKAIDDFAAYIKKGLSNTVWVGGCQSWYLDGDGDPILWPYTWKQWEKEMAEPNMADFDCACFAEEPQLAKAS